MQGGQKEEGEVSQGGGEEGEGEEEQAAAPAAADRLEALARTCEHSLRLLRHLQALALGWLGDVRGWGAESSGEPDGQPAAKHPERGRPRRCWDRCRAQDECHDESTREAHDIGEEVGGPELRRREIRLHRQRHQAHQEHERQADHRSSGQAGHPKGPAPLHGHGVSRLGDVGRGGSGEWCDEGVCSDEPEAGHSLDRVQRP